MSALDPRIEAVRQRYDLSRDDFWQIPQNKQWVCKHAALEIVATKANVEWLPPQIVEAATEQNIAVLIVTGKLGERIEWSTGEASPKNNKNSYPWAMAEKRAKDRVVLKLVGIHGIVYSEEEADDFKGSRGAPEPEAPAKRQVGWSADGETRTAHSLKKDGAWENLIAELRSDFADCHSTVGLGKLRAEYRVKAVDQKWPRAWKEALAEEFDKQEEALTRMETVGV